MDKKQKHHYSEEVELKSLLIRLNYNDRIIKRYNNIIKELENKDYSEEKVIKKDLLITKLKERINFINQRTYNADIHNISSRKLRKYIRWYKQIKNLKYKSKKLDTKTIAYLTSKKSKLRSKLKDKIIKLSEKTPIDRRSYETFGEIVLLIIKNMLKRPNFSGYTYHDDMYSDAVNKIIKYKHNFNHRKMSDKTGLKVNAFSYVSEIIYNSCVYIIKKKKKDNVNIMQQVSMEAVNHNYQLKSDNDINVSTYFGKPQICEIIELTEITGTLADEIVRISEEFEDADRIDIIYPAEYRISFDEYNILKDLLKNKISIIRSRD